MKALGFTSVYKVIREKLIKWMKALGFTSVYKVLPWKVSDTKSPHMCTSGFEVCVAAWVNQLHGQKELFPFNLWFPLEICSVSILLDTASSVLTPLKAGWNCAKSWTCMINYFLAHQGLGYELEGWICLKLVELLFIYLHISAICFQNLLNIIDQCCRNVFTTYFYASCMKILWLFVICFEGLKLYCFN
jgi:hypothetical protein